MLNRLMFARPSLFYSLKVSFRLWLRQALFWAGAFVVAVVAILFAKASAWGNHLFFSIIDISPVFAFIIVPAGFAAIVWTTKRFFQGAEGSGIPQAIASISAPEIAGRISVLSLRIAFGKVILTTLGICFGASVGREGPTVQIGAAVMHACGKRIKDSAPEIQRALILAGGAAGIAAAFNTPLAGIIFAIEELSRSFEEHTNGTVLISVVIAGIVSMALLGNYSYFGHTSAELDLYEAWRPVLICGVIGGLLGGGFSRVLLIFSKGFRGRLGQFIEQRPVAFAAACGFLIAVTGAFSHFSVFGTGYSEAKSLIEQTSDLPATFGLMKLLATFLSYISGIPGGLFAPSLSIGAGMGANIAPFLPDIPTASVIILGMAGYFTGVVQVPITATVIIMEMTDSQSLTLPLMATTFISFVLSKIMCPTPLYRTLAQIFLDRSIRRIQREDSAANRAPDNPA